MKLKSAFNSFLHESVFIILSILFIIFGYPLLLFILAPCLIYRNIVQFVVQKDKKFGRLLTGIDGVFCGKDPYSDTVIVLMPYYALIDKLDIEKVLKTITDKVLNCYPEAKQKIVKKYGYHFFSNIENFQLKDYVSHAKPDCPNAPITRDELRELVSNHLANIPFNRNKSPWQVFLATNYIDDRNPEVKSAIILKVNHCIMDGYAIANVFEKLSSKPWKTIEGNLQAKLEKGKLYTNWIIVLHKFLLLFITGPYHAFKMFLFSNDQHSFVKNSCDPMMEQVCRSQRTPKISGARLKAIKSLCGVSMSALITGLFAQTAYKSMKRSANGTNISKRIHGFISFPLPGHPGTFTNHWSLVRIPIEVNEDEPAKTMQCVEKEFQSLRNSVKPLVFYYIMKFNSMIPIWLRYVTNSVTPSSFLLTNFPGPLEPIDLFGCRGAEISCGGKLSKGTAFVYGCFSYNGDFWFEGAGPKCNLKSQTEANYISDSIMDTLTLLEKGK